jgi:hypothetical protein
MNLHFGFGFVWWFELSSFQIENIQRDLRH